VHGDGMHGLWIIERRDMPGKCAPGRESRNGQYKIFSSRHDDLRHGPLLSRDLPDHTIFMDPEGKRV
jgi:hypothetical protein